MKMISWHVISQADKRKWISQPMFFPSYVTWLTLSPSLLLSHHPLGWPLVCASCDLYACSSCLLLRQGWNKIKFRTDKSNLSKETKKESTFASEYYILYNNFATINEHLLLRILQRHVWTLKRPKISQFMNVMSQDCLVRQQNKFWAC